MVGPICRSVVVPKNGKVVELTNSLSVPWVNQRSTCAEKDGIELMCSLYMDEFVYHVSSSLLTQLPVRLGSYEV